MRYSLSRGVRLLSSENGFFCLMAVPLKAVRINQALFTVLKKLEEGETVEDFSLSLREKFLFERLVRKGILRCEEELSEQPDWPDLPSVSVIIPVKNRSEELRDCLQSLENLNYPKEKLEILVVDDASTDDTFEVIKTFSVNGFRMKSSSGQSACRNFASKKANGDILAFIDSDCLASPQWLADLAPLLLKEGTGAVGGYVDGYFDQTSVDRYEKFCSPLNMGQIKQQAGPDSSHFYLPSCNFLVYRHVCLNLGGFKEELQVGEDVDFCWRLRKAGYVILFSPNGAVYHKHRRSIFPMMKRRFDYGKSEAMLTLHHRDKIKNLPFLWPHNFLFLSLSLFLLIPSYGTLILFLGTFISAFLRKTFLIKRKGIPGVSLSHLFFSTCRSEFFGLYGISCFMTRYYLIPLLVAGWFFPNIYLLIVALFLVAMAGTKLIKKSDLSLCSFALYFFLDQIAYQAGVYKGCLQYRNWRPLLLRLGPTT